MNDPIRSDEQQLDRLVDGELSEAQRRELLLGLDREPDGWRRCALAFLEAQAWEGAMGDLAQPAPAPATPISRPSPSRLARTRAGSPWPLSRFGTALAMAATFLIAVLLTSTINDWRARPGKPAGNEAVARRETPSPVEKNGLEPSRPSPPGDSPWQMFTLTVPDGPSGEPAHVQLPCREGEGLDVNWLQNLPTSMPADVMTTLEKNGYQVRQQRQILPLRLPDGRRLVVPIDQVEVRYIGNRAN